MIRRRHEDLVGDFAAALRGARGVDVAAAGSRAVAARLTLDRARPQLAASLSERERRADLPPTSGSSNNGSGSRRQGVRTPNAR
ncbi:hypothetical protein [Nonomuraea recticatena]